MKILVPKEMSISIFANTKYAKRVLQALDDQTVALGFETSEFRIAIGFMPTVPCDVYFLEKIPEIKVPGRTILINHESFEKDILQVVKQARKDLPEMYNLKMFSSREAAYPRNF